MEKLKDLIEGLVKNGIKKVVISKPALKGNEYKKEKTSRGDNKSHLDIINELLSK